MAQLPEIKLTEAGARLMKRAEEIAQERGLSFGAALRDAAREQHRRRAITVSGADCGPGRGSCLTCSALYGNYHVEGCSQRDVR